MKDDINMMTKSAQSLHDKYGTHYMVVEVIDCCIDIYSENKISKIPTEYRILFSTKEDIKELNINYN